MIDNVKSGIRDILNLDAKEYKRVVPVLFSYLFNRITMEKFVSVVGDRREGLRIKDIARQNGYILKNCKLYAWAVACARHDGRKLPSALSYEVHGDDALILRGLNLKHLDPTKYAWFTLKHFDKVVEHMVTTPEIKNYVGKFVTKKMTFLMRSFGERREDIENFLIEMSIIAVYKQYPRYDSYLHMVNVAKAQTHNKGHSFITSSTSKSRQRLQRNDDGSFDATHVSIATLKDLEAPVAYGAELRERIECLAKIEHRLPVRLREFMLCHAGVHHEGFSTYLSGSNEELATTMPHERYMDKLRQYFGTDSEKIEKAYESVRRRIHKISLSE